MAERGLSQTDVWAAAGLSSSSMTRWVKGQRGRELNKSSLQTLGALSATLDVPLTYWVEYRLYQLGQIARAEPRILEGAYDAIIEEARLLHIPFDEG